MSELKDGGPAFSGGVLPENYGEHGAPMNDGMSLRDYLAAKAMQAIINGRIIEHKADEDGPPMDSEFDNESVAEVSYEVADAMLKEREANYDEPEEVKPQLPPGLQREPKFKDGDKVRVRDTKSSFSGKVGIVVSSIDESIHGWVYRVSFPAGDDVFHEDSLEAAGVEKPKPEFKVDDPVRVRAGIGIFAGKVGVVEAAFPDSLGEGFKYRLHIEGKGLGFRETFYDVQIEAAEEGAKDE